MLDQITVIVLTFNEADNLSRTLDALARFSDIVLVDSGSTDSTVLIANRYSNVRLISRPFDTHAQQWNFGLAQALNRPWILAIDADYVLTPELVDEIATLQPATGVSGFRNRFKYCVAGAPLRGSLYPPVITLFLRDHAHYVQSGHTQRVVVNGDVMDLRGVIHHDDRKPISRWLSSQQRYAALEAAHLITLNANELRFVDRVRRTAVLAPFLVLLHTLVWKRCALDGWRGWFYALQRMTAEAMISLELIQMRLSKKASPGGERAGTGT